MRKFTGFIIVLVGIGMLLDAMNVLHFWNAVGDWWPLIIIAVGIMSWRANPRNLFGPFLAVAIGLIFLLANFNILSENVWSYFWPILIILIGYRTIEKKPWLPDTDMSHDGQDTFVAFSGTEKQVKSDNYTGGNVTAWFGGVKLDLRTANLAENATLKIFTAFGGVEILVPKNVRVELAVTPLFGGADDKSQPDTDAVKKIKISGTVLFGGVEIKN